MSATQAGARCALKNATTSASKRAWKATRSKPGLSRHSSGNASALAQDLGYFDQAHFIADFRKLVGKTPGDYAQAMRKD